MARSTRNGVSLVQGEEPLYLGHWQKAHTASSPNTSEIDTSKSVFTISSQVSEAPTNGKANHFLPRGGQS